MSALDQVSTWVTGNVATSLRGCTCACFVRTWHYPKQQPPYICLLLRFFVPQFDVCPFSFYTSIHNYIFHAPRLFKKDSNWQHLSHNGRASYAAKNQDCIYSRSSSGIWLSSYSSLLKQMGTKCSGGGKLRATYRWFWPQVMRVVEGSSLCLAVVS